VALVNSTTDTLRKPRLRERTDRAWFSRFVRHPARKRSGSNLTTPEPARGHLIEQLLQFLWSSTGKYYLYFICLFIWFRSNEAIGHWNFVPNQMLIVFWNAGWNREPADDRAVSQAASWHFHKRGMDTQSVSSAW